MTHKSGCTQRCSLPLIRIKPQNLSFVKSILHVGQDTVVYVQYQLTEQSQTQEVISSIFSVGVSFTSYHQLCKILSSPHQAHARESCLDHAQVETH